MKRWILGCLSALAAAAVIVVVALAIILRDKPALDAKLSVPAQVTLGSTASMVVSATNPHKQEVELNSIDIDEAFLAGFQVVSVVPEAKETSQIPIVNQRTWVFERKVPPGESLTVTFTLRAVAEGRFTGDVDVCNPSQDYKTHVADVVVSKKQ